MESGSASLTLGPLKAGRSTRSGWVGFGGWEVSDQGTETGGASSNDISCRGEDMEDGAAGVIDGAGAEAVGDVTEGVAAVLMDDWEMSVARPKTVCI